jgi:dTDP-4-amino-4,6-dideoxygalactose transaminase
METTSVPVPFLDRKALHDPLRVELLAANQEVLDRSAFAGGPFVARFEEDFAAYCQTRYAVGVGNGTEALWLALLAHGIGSFPITECCAEEFLSLPMFPELTLAQIETVAREIKSQLQPAKNREACVA